MWWNQIKTTVGSGRVSAGITGKEHEETFWMMVMFYILTGV